MKKFLLFIMAIGFVVALSAGWLAYDFIMTPASSEANKVIFEIVPGESFKKVATELENQHLVSSALKFQILAKMMRVGGRVRVGEYAINGGMKPREILNVFVSGKSIEHPVTIIEGSTKWDVAEVFEKAGLGTKKDFLDVCANRGFIKELLGEDLPSLEGYLFPETYNVTKYTGARSLVRMMVTRFLEVYGQIPPNPDVHLTRHQMVILASIVEKETGANKERGLVASVFHNRLNLKMKLQTDPTVIYGLLDAHLPYNGNIHKEDLLRPTRYNTYTLDALPFGPIGNPGREALMAAIHPEKSDFLYFVSRNDGTQVYSKDYGDHSKAVAKFQLDPKQRTGKSWRDLAKKQDKEMKKKRSEANVNSK